MLQWSMIFDSWQGLARVLAVGALAYVGLVVILRISGKRTLSKLNAFDLVVTVALGSTLATVLLNKSVALVEGVVALGWLVLMQFLITWSSVRSATFQRIIKAEPSLLVHQGRYNTAMLVRERITREEIEAAVRASGVADVKSVAAVVLETDGTLSILQQADSGSGTLSNVQKVPEPNA